LADRAREIRGASRIALAKSADRAREIGGSRRIA